LASVLFLQACAVRQSGNWPTISAKDSKLYIAYQKDVISLDVAKKAEAWRFQGESSVEFYAPPAPVAGEDTLYLADFGRSAGIMAGGGLLVSMYSIKDGSGNPPQTQWVREDQITGRIVSGLLIEDNIIYTGTSNNQIIAVDRTNGDLLWETPTENAVWSPPASSNGTIFVSSIDRNIYAINQSDGKIKWTHTLNGAGAGSPVVSADGKRVYAGSFGGEVIALNVEDGSDIWKTQAANADWVWGAPVELEDELVYGDVAGNIFAVNALTGEDIWSATVDGSIVGDLIIADNAILVGSGNEETFTGAITAFSLKGEKIWSTSTGANLQSSPILLNNGTQVAAVYGSAVNEIPLGVNVIDIADGSIYWSWTLTEVEEE
jgi:outer membrane protein assembly factor BamB